MSWDYPGWNNRAGMSDALHEDQRGGMNFKRFMFLFTMLAVLTMTVRVSVASDTWWHLRAGSWIVEQHAILDADPFSLTRQGEPWIYPGWMAELALYFAYIAAGYAGLNLLTAALILAAFIFLWDTTKARPLLKSVLILLAAITSAVYWSARPHIFSFLLSSVFLWVLEKERAKPGWLLWILPPLMGLWANLHGGFAIGFILIMIYLLGIFVKAVGDWFITRARLMEIWRIHRIPAMRLVGVGIVAAGFLGLNPHGFAMLTYPLRTVSIGSLQNYIQEWQSPDFHQLQVQPFLWMILLTLLAFSLTNVDIHPVEVISAGIFMAMSLLAVRNIATYALVSAPILARHFDSVFDRFPGGEWVKGELPTRLTHWINTGLLILLLIPAGLKMRLPLLAETNKRAIAEAYPQAAIEYLKNSTRKGNLFNSYNWGAYLIWELYPERLSFVDGRTDLFDDAILEQYITVWRGEDPWGKILSDWKIMLVMVEPEAPLHLRLELAGWDLLYEDNQAVIMSRPE